MLGKSSERNQMNLNAQKDLSIYFEETSTTLISKNQNILLSKGEFKEAEEIPEEFDNLSLTNETFENLICPGIKVTSIHSNTITKILSSEVIMDLRKNSCVPFQLNKEINSEWYAYSTIVKGSASRNKMKTKEDFILIQT